MSKSKAKKHARLVQSLEHFISELRKPYQDKKDLNYDTIVYNRAWMIQELEEAIKDNTTTAGGSQ